MTQAKQKNQTNTGDCPPVCEKCKKLCEEAKINVIKLQKTVLALTIISTAAITLLGEKGIESLISSLNGIKKASSIVEDNNDSDKNTSEEDAKNIPHLPNPNAKKQQRQTDKTKSSDPADVKEKQLTSVITDDFIIPSFIGPEDKDLHFRMYFPQVVMRPEYQATFNLPSSYAIQNIGYSSGYFGSLIPQSYDDQVYKISNTSPCPATAAYFSILMFTTNRRRRS